VGGQKFRVISPHLKLNTIINITPYCFEQHFLNQYASPSYQTALQSSQENEGYNDSRLGAFQGRGSRFRREFLHAASRASWRVTGTKRVPKVNPELAGPPYWMIAIKDIFKAY
jgi:hypothetical protein